MKKKLITVILGLFILLAFMMPQINARAVESAKTVDVMFLHDTHSQFTIRQIGKSPLFFNEHIINYLFRNLGKKIQIHFYWMRVISQWGRWFK